MSNPKIYNTGNARMKQEISDVKKYFMKSLDSLKLEINDKFNNINGQLVTINRRNNLDIQGIPDSVPDDQLEEKVIEIFS